MTEPSSNLATAAAFTRLFLYGIQTNGSGQYVTPELLTDRLRDLAPGAAGATVQISAQAYMSSYGVYAVPARAQFVNDFFTGAVSLAAGTYTVAELKGTYGASGFRFTFSHAQVDIGHTNYMERAYVFGHAGFFLTDDTKFVVAADGSLSMIDVRVMPENDNFDFESTGLTQYLNDFYLEPEIDPSKIGRVVTIQYSGTVASSIYDTQAFTTDVGRILSWDAGQAGAGAIIAGNIIQFVHSMRDDGVYENERDGRTIIYDGQQENALDASQENAAILIGGSGDDQLRGSLGDDIIYGGNHNDTLLSSLGSDELWGGDEAEKAVYFDTDLADYSGLGTGLTIAFTGDAGGYSLTVTKRGLGTDTLHDIEKILGTSRSDYLSVSGDLPEDLVLEINAAGGSDAVVNFENAGEYLHLNIDDLGNGSITQDGNHGSIQLLDFHTQIIGSNYDDEITDLSEHDGMKRVDGGVGDDEITVDGSDAMIRGGLGDDTITAGEGNDRLFGEDGIDIVHGGDGSDWLENQHFDGAPGIVDDADELFGDDGADYLHATATSAGAIFSGGAGNDVLDARGSRDVIARFGEGDGHDMILSDRELGVEYAPGQEPRDGVELIDMSGVSKSGVTIIWNPTHLIEDHPPSGNPTDIPGYLLRQGDLVIRIDATGDTILVKNIRGSTTYWSDPGEASQPPFNGPGDHIDLHEIADLVEFADGRISSGDFLGANPVVKLEFGSVDQYATALDEYRAATDAAPGANDGTGGDDEMGGSGGDDAMSGGDGNDSFSSSGGSDSIDGGAGSDTLSLFGARADFTFTFDAGTGDVIVADKTGLEGTIRVKNVETFYFATDNAEYRPEDLVGYHGTEGDDALTGTAHDNQLFGLAGNDVLTGNGGADLLDGGAGIDAMAGGAGDDTYYVGDAGDSVTEAADEGADLVVSSISWALGDHVEALTLTGTGAIEGVGNQLDNALSGNDAANRLVGGAGDDTLDGGDGDDILRGDGGNLIVNGSFEEGGAGATDYWWGTTYTTLTGWAKTNASAFKLVVSPHDGVYATDGGHWFDLDGLFTDTNMNVTQTITTLAAGASFTLNFDAASRAAAGSGTFDVLWNGVVIASVAPAGVTMSSYQFTVVAQSGANVLGFRGTGTADGIGASLDRVALIPVAPGGGDDILIGGAGNDYLIGGAGADSMTGGLGNDTYYVDNAADLAIELAGEGTDRIAASASYAMAADAEIETLEAEDLAGTGAIDLTGSSVANTIVGNNGINILRGEGGNDALAGLAGNDYLVGGTGADVMHGGLGDDTFYVDDALDQANEAAGEGTDRVAAYVSYTLATGSRIEILDAADLTAAVAMNLTGNEIVNTITGNNGVNFLYGLGGNDTLSGFGGNDALVGGTGADIMYGGAGDDTYYVDDAGDQANELSGEGNDRIATSISLTLDAGSEVEVIEAVNLTDTTAMNLTGSNSANTITGNAGVNFLFGGGGNDQLFAAGGDDYLIGGTGNDMMQGGTGNDVYYVDAAGDVIDEAAGAGTDRVSTEVSYTLGAGASIELFEAGNSAGTAAMDLTGNAGDTTIVGNAGVNTLNGGLGADVLVGLGGADTFAFTAALGGTNVDTIDDFAHGIDKIALDDALFTGLSTGALASGAFVIGTAAADADDRIVYNSATGALYFDADGNGAGAAVQFATMTGLPTLSASDFMVI